MSLPCDDAENCLTYLSKKVIDCLGCIHNQNTQPELGVSQFISLNGEPHSSKKRQKARKGPVNTKKSKQYQDASKSENRGYQAAVKASANSGRVRNDGDFSINNIGVDNKYQGKTKSPKIDPKELDKAKIDARRQGKTTGCLRIENSEGRAFYVLDEEDFLRLFL